MATQGNESAATTTTTHMVCHQAYPSYNMSAKMPSVPQWLMINDDRATMMTLATGRADCMSRTIFVASMDGHYLSLGCEENASPSLTGEIVGKKIARAKKQKNPRGEGERDSGIQDAALLPPGGRRRRDWSDLWECYIWATSSEVLGREAAAAARRNKRGANWNDIIKHK
uniref:Uncharacterized protein n=1 Tax=Oryza meridionalis TaxID=40149 RepID=A0A0E0D4G6_9ORYZ